MISADTSLDALTHLPGYNAFVDEFSSGIDGNDAPPVSLILVDIDGFGKVNDARGRGGGDATIAALGQYLGERTPEDGRVYRYGGDAFMVMLSGIEKEQAFLVAESLRAEIATGDVVGVDERAIQSKITVSCGVAAYPDDGNQTAGLLRKVCEALYRAKVSGRNKVALAREEKMVTKTVHYTQGQLEGLQRLAKREGPNEATLLREALDDLLRKYNS
jgi:diguanylate cyclase (GGDEF)-like protein